MSIRWNVSKNIPKPKICATAENYQSNKHASNKMHKWDINKLANKQLWVRLSKFLTWLWRCYMSFQKISRVANKFLQVANIYRVPTYPRPFPSPCYVSSALLPPRDNPSPIYFPTFPSLRSSSPLWTKYFPSKKNCSFPFFVHLLLHGLTISRLHMLSFSISFSSSLQIKYFPCPCIFHLQSFPPSWRNSPSYSSPFMFFSSYKVHHWVWHA